MNGHGKSLQVLSFWWISLLPRDPDDIGYLMLSRMFHNQAWISLSRYFNACSPRCIVNRSLEFDQVDRESHWDDQIILNGIVYYLGYSIFPGADHLPLWKNSGATVIALMRTGPVEFLYYWLHRALHHHFLYARYHSHRSSRLQYHHRAHNIMGHHGEEKESIAKELNGGDELYLEQYPKLKVKLVVGSSLPASVVLNSIPEGTKEVLLCGHLSKVACAVIHTLCQKGSKGLRPTVEIWRILIVVLCQAGNVPLGFGLFGKIIDSRSLPTVVTYTFLIKGLLKARMLSEAIGVWDIMVIASVAVDRRLAALDTKLY
ncbi:uncharacterized protein A4U43_C03F2560 [Asparagus officinalis]|uniref:Fatty acid hydroxylase domain-containing protein n=1 Tax=Asparagus officinalis TaxID=4686 RepID=A0A5P1FB85_ASPOF|nr:uncharacterized protein A4U43_C03F2560 [Asparagus officinalis]